MTMPYAGLLFGIALSTSSGMAKAELLHFQYTGTEEFSFNLGSIQKPSSYDDNVATYDSVVFTLANGNKLTSRIDFNSAANDGGFTAYLNPVIETEQFGTIFFGLTDAPTFHVGTFQLVDANGPDTGTLVVSSVSLPSAAPMFGAALLGLAGLGYAAKRKKAASAA